MPSVPRETGRSLPEAWKDFDPGAFKINDPIAFHNPRTHRWEKGVLTDHVPVMDRDSRRIFLKNGSARGIELEIPPKRVDPDILKKTITLAIEDKPGKHTGVKYRVQRDATTGNPIWNIGPDGEIEVTLMPVSGGTNHKEISNVNLEAIRSVREIETVERGIDASLAALRTEINSVDNIRRKKLLADVNDLDQKVRDMVNQMGHFDELGDIDAEEVKRIAGEIKKLRKVAEDGLLEVQSNLRSLQTELAARGTGDAARKRVAEEIYTGRVLDRQKDADDEWSAYDADQEKIRVHGEWVNEIDPAFAGGWAERRAARIAEIAAWDAAVPPAGGGGGARRGGPRRPDPFNEKRPDEPPRPATPPVPRPTYSKDKLINAYNIFSEMQPGGAGALPAVVTGAPDPYEAHRFLIRETERKLTEKKVAAGMAGTASYTPATKEQKITGEIFLKVLEDWKNKDVVETEVFDFAKEKGELEAKLKATRERFDEVVLKNPTFVTTPLVRDLLTLLNGYNKGTPNIEKLLADVWRDVSTIEVEIYREEHRTAGHGEKEKDIDVDLPPNILMEILRTRPREVHGLMHHAYNTQIDGKSGNESIVEGLRQIFEPAPTQSRGRDATDNLVPNERMIARLRQYGIKDWRHFKKLWDEKLAPKAATLLQAVAQDDVRGEIARNSSTWDNMRALGWQLSARIATNLVLIGGATFGAAALFATGGLAGLGLAAAAGASAGGVRAFLQKFVFGSKWLEGRKKNQLEALALRQREQAIQNLLARRFGAAHETAPVINDDCARMFTALLATAAREASAEFVKTDDEEGAGLQGDARRLYVQAIKDIRLGGDIPSAEQRAKCALAIRRIMANGDTKVAEAAQGDPMVIRMLDGVMQGFSGTKASRENYGVAGACGTVAAGAAVGVAFAADQWWARGAMGALGGATAGYHWGEGRRMRGEREAAQTAVESEYRQLHPVLIRVLRALESRRGTANRADLNTLTAGVQRFDRLLAGKFDSVEEQRAAQILAEEKTLRIQVMDLVYQTRRRGVFAARALGTLENHATEIERANAPVTAGKTRAWWQKTLSRAGYTVGGALAGAGAAIALGYGFQQLKEVIGIGVPPVSTEAKAAGGVAAATVVAGGAGHPPTGGGAHDIVPTGGKGAEVHEIVVNKSPDYVAKSLDVVDIKKGGSAWGGIDHLKGGMKAGGLLDSAGHIKGTKMSFDDWRHSELERMGYKFLPGGKIAHPYMIHPGAKMELYTGGDGQPHARLIGLEDGKVKILDQYIVRGATAKPLEVDVVPKSSVEPVAPEQLSSPLKADALRFEAEFKNNGADVVNDISDDNLRGASGRVTNVQAIGEAGYVAVTLEDGNSTLAIPFRGRDGAWHITYPGQDGLDVPSVRDAAQIDAAMRQYAELQHPELKGVSVPEDITNVKAGGSHKAGFVKTGMAVDKSHLSDVLSGKGHPEVTTVSAPEAPHQVITPEQVAEYTKVYGDLRTELSKDLKGVLHDIIHNSAAEKMLLKDIDQAIKGQLEDVRLGRIDDVRVLQALDIEGRSLPPADQLRELAGTLSDHLSSESKLLLTPFDAPAGQARAIGAEAVQVAPGDVGSHALKFKLFDGREGYLYDNDRMFTKDATDGLLVVRPDGTQYLGKIVLDAAGKPSIDILTDVPVDLPKAA